MGQRIVVVGAGAVGCLVGGLLTRAGHDVTLADQWPEHVEAMRRHGLRLSGTCGNHVIPVRALHLHELQGVAEPFDAAFIAVKGYVDAAAGRGLEDVEADVSREAASRAGGRPSMLQDVMRGRRTEIDQFNGYVVAQGRRLGVPTPFNETVVRLVNAQPVGALRPGPGRVAPLLEMLA